MPIDSANHFNVRPIDGQVAFSVFQEVEGKQLELRAELDPEVALNLAAWLVVIADQSRYKQEFIRLLREIAVTRS